MKLTLILVLAASFYAFAQEGGNVTYQSAGPAGAIAWGSFEKGSLLRLRARPIPPRLTTNPSRHSRMAIASFKPTPGRLPGFTGTHTSGCCVAGDRQSIRR